MKKSDLESRLTLLFSTMERRKASLRREEEDRKLSRRRFWRQDKDEKTCPASPKP